jgi:hypothetical protein
LREEAQHKLRLFLMPIFKYDQGKVAQTAEMRYP